MAFTIPSIFTAIDKMTAPLKKMEASVKNLSKQINILPKLNSALGLAGLSIGFGTLAVGAKKFIDEAAKVEDATAGFQSLLGSVEKAKSLVSDLYKMGAATPFEFSDLEKNARMLIGFGVATKDTVIPMLSKLGDVAQGNADKLGGITLAFSQIQAAGKANLGDVNQLINNGVPILKILAEQWHTTVGKAREMVTAGKATGIEVTKAFTTMTSKGGMFYNGMAIASQTFTGKMSTLHDTINQTFASIGNVVLPIAKQYVDKISDAVGKAQNWATANKELINVKVAEWAKTLTDIIQFLIKHFDQIVLAIKLYIGTLIVLRAITLVTTAITYGFAIAQGAVTIATGAWTAAQWLLNVALTANPVGLIIVAIAALIALVVVIVKKWDDWGAALTVFMGPLGIVISLIMSVKDNWTLVTKAFKEEGILGGLKAIGKVLLDVILKPLQSILQLASRLPGKMGEWAKAGADQVADFRHNMGLGGDEFSNPKPIVAPTAQTQAAMQKYMSYGQVDVNVTATNGAKADVVKRKGVNVSTSSTLGPYASGR